LIERLPATTGFGVQLAADQVGLPLVAFEANAVTADGRQIRVAAFNLTGNERVGTGEKLGIRAPTVR
jgi:hypothetical protein